MSIAWVIKIKRGEIKLKTPLQRHMDNLGNKSEEGEETNINKKEPHDAALNKEEFYIGLKRLLDGFFATGILLIAIDKHVEWEFFVIAIGYFIFNYWQLTKWQLYKLFCKEEPSNNGSNNGNDKRN